MTKCIIIGKEPTKTKSIELIHTLETTNSLTSPVYAERTSDLARNYDCVELICRGYANSGLDLMFAYSKGIRDKGFLYIGHWNDGVV